MFRKYLFLFFIGVFISMPVYGLVPNIVIPDLVIGDGFKIDNLVKIDGENSDCGKETCDTTEQCVLEETIPGECHINDGKLVCDKDTVIAAHCICTDGFTISPKDGLCKNLCHSDLNPCDLGNAEINYDFSLLKETENIKYVKSYIYYDNEYRVAILSFSEDTQELNIIKIY